MICTLMVRWAVSAIAHNAYKHSDLSKEVQKALREDYANSKNFYDGDIYRHLRKSHVHGDLLSKRKWLSRLSTTKQRDVKDFEKRATRSYLIRCFSDALDALIPYMGLWPAFQIGTFHRILPLRCHEVFVHSSWERFDY